MTENNHKNSLKRRIRIFATLQILFFVYSFSSVLSKMAGRNDLLSTRFVGYYFFSMLLLGIYAVGWQQIIKCVPLVTAYSCKAVTMLWSCLWGTIIFSEHVTLGRSIGIFLVVGGVFLVAKEDYG